MCDFEKLDISYSYGFRFDKLQKFQNIFVCKCLKISQIFHGGDRNHIKVYKWTKNLKIDRIITYHHLRALLMSFVLFDLFPVLSECIILWIISAIILVSFRHCFWLGLSNKILFLMRSLTSDLVRKKYSLLESGWTQVLHTYKK